MTFSKAEREFLEKMSDPDRSYEDVFREYGRNYFNVLRHRIREKAQEMKKDLELFEKIKNSKAMEKAIPSSKIKESEKEDAQKALDELKQV